MSSPTVSNGTGHGVEQRTVLGGQLPGGRDLPEALRDHGCGAVDQVAPARDELVVGASYELGPGEVTVLVLRSGRGDEVAQRIGLVALQHVADVDHDRLRGRELAPLHGEELRRHDLGRQVQLPVGPRLPATVAASVVREELGGPDLAVEGDVVLAHEVVGQRLPLSIGRRVPPVAPAVGLTEAAGPLDRRGQVADHRVEPDVEPLARVLPPPVERDRDAPVDVAGHRPWADVLEDVLAELDHVRPPGAGRLTLVEPRLEGIGQRRQVEEEVLGLHELRDLAVDLAPRVDQVGRVELVAAVVALVAARAVVPADRADALDVAVRQRAAGRRRDRAVSGLLDHVPVLVNGGEHLLDDRIVVAGRGPGEQVVGQPQRLEVLDDQPVVPVGELACGDTLLVRGDEDRGSVLVGAGDHEHVVASHPHVATEHVGGHAETGYVADVARAVGIRPCDGGQNFAHAPNPMGGDNVFPRPAPAELSGWCTAMAG